MKFPASLFLALIGLAFVGSRPVSADEPLPADKPVEEVIDFYIDARLQKENVTPAPAADDANFIRRVTLDLAGRIPTPAESQAHVTSTDADKKQKLVDRLLAAPDFAYHQRNQFDLMLMDGKDNGEWRAWLLKAIQENRPWSEMFRQIILTRDDDEANKHALAFLKNRARNLDDITNDTSKAFFGVSINCAKCHDHPLVLDWTQDHFYGMASFFNRTFINKKNFLGEREDGSLKFRTTAGEEKQAKLMFLTGATVEEPVPAEQLNEEERKKGEKRRKELENGESIPAAPPFSRRAQLVDLALKPDPNSFFSRSFANRLWARVFGTGIVTPLDQMHSENKPSHPELLTWLARDAESHNYDLKRILRGLVLSKAYARSSRWETGERPSERLFAVAEVRPLTPMQFSLSLVVATSSPANLSLVLEKPDEWVNRRRDYENQAHGFSREIEIPGDNFQVSVSEAMLFSNNGRIENEYLRDGGDRLVGVLKGISDRPQLIQTAYQSVFSRFPTPEELEPLASYLAAREDRQLPALQQFVWSLITSGEFRFNY